MRPEKKIMVLLIENSFFAADLNIRQLEKMGFSVHHRVVANVRAMGLALEEQFWDLILSDYSLVGFNALDALAERNKKNPNIPFIIVSEKLSESKRKQAFEAGCYGFISKADLMELGVLVHEAIK